MAQMYAEEIPNVRSTAQVTKASAENMNLLQAGRGELAWSLADSVSDAWEGNEDAGFKSKLDKLRGVTRTYNNFIQIVATLQSAGLGVSFIRDLATAIDIEVITIPAENVENVGSYDYIPATIPAGTYDGEYTDISTAAIPNFLVTHEDVPEEIVYEMTKVFYENLESLQSTHSVIKAV